jgi:hypothetical protein
LDSFSFASYSCSFTLSFSLEALSLAYSSSFSLEALSFSFSLDSFSFEGKELLLKYYLELLVSS